MKNFWMRTLTGAAFAVTVLGAILLGGWWFVSLFGLVVFWGMHELQRMLNVKPVSIQRASGFITGLTIWAISSATSLLGIDNRFWLTLVPIVIGTFIAELYRAKDRPFWNIATTLLLPLYVVVPFVFLQKIAFIEGIYNPYLVLAFFAMVWVNDTGAYLVGVTIGKRRLFPRVSPKKSWEGFIGGVVFTIALSYGISLYIDGYPMLLWLAAGVVVSVFGTLGDLTESMLKRAMDVKDSGSLLPGHGGVLDRFDAVTFAAPLVYVLFEIFK
jgi:phosphatidate cytidylyltransferase